MASTGRQRQSFFPTADAAILQSNYDPPSQRPDAVGPVFDVEHVNKALQPWSDEVKDLVYPLKTDMFGPAPVPHQPACTADRYLFPVLTQNERLRLTMLWYYTRGSLEDVELQSRLQEKVHLAQETIGWEFVIVGLLDLNTYTRLVTVGLPLAVLPRRESTCAHTVNQPPQVSRSVMPIATSLLTGFRLRSFFPTWWKIGGSKALRMLTLVDFEPTPACHCV
jgi:hypothetical protein